MGHFGRRAIAVQQVRVAAMGDLAGGGAAHRVDQAGDDDIGGDLVIGELGGERPGHPDQGHFRSRHIDPPGDAAVGR